MQRRRVAAHFHTNGCSPSRCWVLGLAAFFVFGLDKYLSFEALRQNRAALLDWVDTYGIVAALIYMLIYAAAIAFSLPGGAVLTITGGFLFGSLLGTLCVVIAANCWCHSAFCHCQDVVWRRPACEGRAGASEDAGRLSGGRPELPVGAAAGAPFFPSSW